MEFGFGSFYAGGLLPFVNYGLYSQLSNSVPITADYYHQKIMTK